MELWDWSLTVSKDAEMKARIGGVKRMITTFDFYFGCTLGEQLLRQTDNLGCALEDSSKKYALNRRTEARGQLTWAIRLAPRSHFVLATGLGYLGNQ